MGRILSAVGIAVVMLLWASAAAADTTYTVTWRDSSPGLVAERFGITRAELFGANPRKIWVSCLTRGEDRGFETRLGSQRPCRGRRVEYLQAGDVLAIPAPRAEVTSQNQSLREERDGLVAERDSLRERLSQEQGLRERTELSLEQVRAETRRLGAAVKQLRAKEARSTTATVALVSVGTAIAAVLLAFIVVYRERGRTGNMAKAAARKEEEAEAALRGIREQERTLLARELAAKDWEADLRGKQAKAERDAQTAGRRLSEAEANRVALDAREREIRAREDEFEQVRLRQEALLARCKEEAEQSAQQLAEMRLQTEFDDIRRAREELETERATMRRVIEAGLREEYDAREQRIQAALNLVEGVDQERLRIEAERTELEELRKSLARREAHLAERGLVFDTREAVRQEEARLAAERDELTRQKKALTDQEYRLLERETVLDERDKTLTRREDDLAAHDSLVDKGFLPPRSEEPPKKRPTLPVMSMAGVILPPTEAVPDTEDDSERERTRIKTNPLMAAVTVDATPAQPDPATGSAAGDVLIGQGDISADFEPVPETTAVRCRHPGCGETLPCEEMFVHRAMHAETAVDPEGPAAEILRAEPPTDEAGGGNGSAVAGEIREEPTRDIKVPGFYEYDPACTAAGDEGLLTCECGCARLSETEWAAHQKVGHLKCTFCNPPVIIQTLHRRRHMKRAHPEVVDHPAVSGRRRSRPPKESSGSGE